MKRIAALLLLFLCLPANAYWHSVAQRAVSTIPGALACSYTPITTGTQSTAYTGATPSASGGTPTYTFSETGTLPGGISINSSTGVISGTPSASGTFPTIQVKVTDSTSTVANCGSSFTLTISPSGGTTPAFVQGNTFQNGAPSVDTVSVTLASAVASSHLVIAVYCGGIASGDTVSITDDKLNTYTSVFANPIVNSTGYGCFLGYLANATNGPKIITANSIQSRPFVTMIAEEWSNILTTSPVDGTPQNSTQVPPPTSANGVVTPTVTTTASGDLVWGFTVSANSTGMSNGTGFTGHQAVDTTFYTEALIQTSAGAITATFTALAGGDNTVTFTIAFKHS